MYYRFISFHTKPEYENSFLELADSLRENMKNIEGLPFIDYVKTGDNTGTIVISYESEQNINASERRLRRAWHELKNSGFIGQVSTMTDGEVLWML